MMTTHEHENDENLFENRSEDEELAPYEDEKKKNKDVQREKEEQARKRSAGEPQPVENPPS
jgi:hypothetical protein